MTLIRERTSAPRASGPDSIEEFTTAGETPAAQTVVNVISTPAMAEVTNVRVFPKPLSTINTLNNRPRSGHHSGSKHPSLQSVPEVQFMPAAPHPLVLRGREAL